MCDLRLHFIDKIERNRRKNNRNRSDAHVQRLKTKSKENVRFDYLPPPPLNRSYAVIYLKSDSKTENRVKPHKVRQNHQNKNVPIIQMKLRTMSFLLSLFVSLLPPPNVFGNRNNVLVAIVTQCSSTGQSMLRNDKINR